jgi:hypothetical protein
MRFSTIAFVTGAAAQLTTLNPVISKITSDVSALDSAINSYTSGDASAVLSAGKTLLADIQAGVTTAKGSADLSQTDALQLTTPIQGLQTATEGVIKDLTGKKCAFNTAGKSADILSNLQEQLTASQALADAITSKVPQALQSVAATLSSGIATALQGGITSFKDTSSCPAAPGGGSSSSAAPSSAPSGSAPSSTFSILEYLSSKLTITQQLPAHQRPLSQLQLSQLVTPLSLAPHLHHQPSLELLPFTPLPATLAPSSSPPLSALLSRQMSASLACLFSFKDHVII